MPTRLSAVKAVTYFSFMEKGPNRLSGRSHTHDDSCEILWLCEGEGSMMIGDRLYPMRKNAVYLIGAREVHSAVPTGDGASYLRTAVGVNERFLTELASLGGFEAEVNALFARRCIPCGTKAQMLEKEFQTLARALHPERAEPRVPAPSEPPNPHISALSEPSHPHVSVLSELPNPHVSVPSEPSNPHVSALSEPSDPCVSAPSELPNPVVPVLSELPNPHISVPSEPPNPHISVLSELPNPCVSAPSELPNPHISAPSEPSNPRVPASSEPSNPRVSASSEPSNPHISVLSELPNPHISVPSGLPNPVVSAQSAASLPDAQSDFPDGEPDGKNALIITSCLLDLLRILSGCAEPSEKTEDPPDDPADPPVELPEKRLPIAETLRFIDENLGEPLTLDLLSSRVYLSKTYFCRLFRESTRMSPMTYITARRISLAKKLLLESGLSVSETALAAGFGSFSNFSNMFRKSEGVTPREYVKRRRSPPA